MILAGLVLVAVGAVDLGRLARGRSARIVLAVVGAALLFVSGTAIGAAGWALVAIIVAAVWTLVMSRDGSGRAGLWPVAALATLVTIAVAASGPRPGIRVFGAAVQLPGPDGGTPLDTAVLVVGCGLFLAESANLVVRAALRGEAVREAGSHHGGLKGGRLIGPLERLLVFSLTATGAYTLLAAVLAAKGIVRFPEISRDSGEGDRAEYFLVGTLVSWTLGLAAAFLVWWGTAPR